VPVIENPNKVKGKDILDALQTTESGLSSGEAERRLSTYGANEIGKREKKNYFRMYIIQYTHFFAVLLEIAALLSFVANTFSPGEGYDILGWAIFGAVIINASFAFWQEYKADKTVEALLRLIPTIVNVRRDGKLYEITAGQLVPGDIILLEEGDRVAADAIILGENSLYLNNATLTGESRPQRRFAGTDQSESLLDAKNVVLAGTSVTSGNGYGVVFATGMETEFGKIASLTREVQKRRTPMEKEITRITRILTLAALLMGGVFFTLGFFSGQGYLVAAIFALSLIVANVPEGMLPTITLSLSLASRNMARRKALIKNLDSVQTLGSATIICTDKTGTITRNEMTIKEIYLSGGEQVSVTGEGYFQDGEFSFDEERAGSRERLASLLRAGMLNCRAVIKEDQIFGDPTELAIIAAARKGRIKSDEFSKLDEIPFSSERKMMSTIYEVDGRRMVYSKGAVEVLLPLCSTYIDKNGEMRPFGKDEKELFNARAEELMREAYRVLAIASGEGENEDSLSMLGLVAIMDLPREEVYGAIEKCRRAGIRVLMLTGDNPLTASAIAGKIGLPFDLVLTGDETRVIEDEKLQEILSSRDVLFARMRSEQKLRITRLLQRIGEVVAITGDGVNDAPALRKADIGIAMGIKGTEVAKEAADMILLDDNFASIVAAIEEGRTVYFNIKKFVTYILSSNVPEIVPYILYFFLLIPLPLSVIQILTIDLGSDMLPGLALGSEGPEEDIMNRPPVGRNENILDLEVFKRGYFFLGAIEGTAAMVAFLGFLFLNGWIYGDLPIDPLFHRQAMTMTLLAAVTCQLFNVWTLRSWEFSAFSRGFLKNRLLILAIIIELLWIATILTVQPVQVIFNTAFVSPVYLLLLLPFPVLLFTSHELYKYFIRRKRAKELEIQAE
jgi:sodium/potassium-transporting ATPase subunit alpha